MHFFKIDIHCLRFWLVSTLKILACCLVCRLLIFPLLFFSIRIDFSIIFFFRRWSLASHWRTSTRSSAATCKLCFRFDLSSTRFQLLAYTQQPTATSKKVGVDLAAALIESKIAESIQVCLASMNTCTYLQWLLVFLLLSGQDHFNRHCLMQTHSYELNSLFSKRN